MERFLDFFYKPQRVFLIFGFIFGLLFLILTPPFQVPDEPAHFHRAIEAANGVFYNKEVPKFSEYDRILQQSPKINAKLREMTQNFHTVSGYSPVMYLSSAIGVKIGGFFQKPLLMFYLARLFNMFVWLALMYFSIKITPVFKWHFTIFALLPMSIYEGMSISADSFVNGFLFLFFAYMFKLIFTEEKLSSREIVIYCCMTLISALLKGCLIYPAFLILFVKDKHKWLIASLIITLSVLIGGMWAANNHIATGPQINPEINKELIFSSPLRYCHIFLNTFAKSTNYWLYGAIGIFGWLDVRFPMWIYLLTLTVYASTFITIPSEKQINKLLRITACGLIFTFMLIVLTIEFCTWTDVNAIKISGFQGRYLICIFPLFFLMLVNNKILINSTKYIKYYLIYIFILLTYSCYVLHNVYQFS